MGDAIESIIEAMEPFYHESIIDEHGCFDFAQALIDAAGREDLYLYEKRNLSNDYCTIELSQGIRGGIVRLMIERKDRRESYGMKITAGYAPKKVIVKRSNCERMTYLLNSSD
jgi:hypothetical protein